MFCAPKTPEVTTNRKQRSVTEKMKNKNIKVRVHAELIKTE